MNKIFSSIYSWADQRLGLAEMMAFAKHKTVPEHKHSFWYYWGGISLLFFIIQVVTGVLLLVYYRPGPDAYESVRQINSNTNFGWLIRSIHSWAANLMVAAVMVHMFSVFFMKAYRNPREFGWWSGIALLGLCMVFGFSGYLLPMDELAFFATRVGVAIPESIPHIGPALASFIRGGSDVNEFTVQRFFALHVVVLPLIFIPILMFHLYLVQKHGNAWPPSEEAKAPSERKTIPFFPNFMMHDLAMWLVVINVLAVLAVIFPWDLGPQADSVKATPLGIHPEWYFMSQFQLLKVIGKYVEGAPGEILGIGIFTGAMFAWTLIPLYDTSSRLGKRARAATYFGLFILIAGLVTTIWGYFAI